MESRSRYLSLAMAVLVGIILSCDGYGMYGVDLHHRFSDPVKGILGFDEAPEKGSWEYYKVLADGDRFHRGRHLASSKYQSPLIFSNGNDTNQLGGSFGFLHYANISIGTPSSSYLVALDTGSDLFWLPCDCHEGGCVRSIRFSNGQEMTFSIYSTNTSSTGSKVACNNTMCAQRRRCASDSSPCPYQVVYLSNGTSSTGVLVEDVLHLTTDDSERQIVDAPITFGCGRVQTGSFIEGAAPNGLIGLGIEDIAIPTILAKNGFTSNSFSMCFGEDGVGRIRFGDNGTADQSETPFNLRQSHPTYDLTVTQISVGGTTADLEFHAIYDSGTSFTYLTDPAYTQITESFNMQTKEDRHRNNSSNIPFEYCYDMGPNQKDFLYPTVNLTMKGGQDYAVYDPLIVVSIDQDKLVYCLAVIKSRDINLIGQNFMTGYRVIFDREKLVLGWKKSNCYEDEETTMIPLVRSNSPAISPVSTIDPEATSETTNRTVRSVAGPSSNHSTNITSFIYLTLLLIFSPLFLIFL